MTGTEVLAPAAAENVDGGRGFSVPAPVATLARWTIFIAALAIALRPILLTTIGGDDFIIPALQYGTGGASFTEALQLGWRGASLGHFNYAGQVIGAIVAWVWVQATLHYGINFSLVFALTKLIVYTLTVLAAARFIRVGLVECGVFVTQWRTRSLVAIALVGTLQLHLAWSNDPTANFPMSGFASAALGFWILSFSFPRLSTPSIRGAFETAGVAVLGILYYEVNAAVVVAFVPPLLVGIAHEQRWRRLSNWAIAAVPLMTPALAAVALQFVTKPPPEEAYSGTAISPAGMLPTFRDAIVSSLPGSAWNLTRAWVDRPIAILVRPTLILVALMCLAAALHHCYGPVQRQRVRDVSAGVAGIGSVVLYWFIATGIQAATPKVQAESHGVGFVYSYYAVGATSVAVLLVVGAIVMMPRLPSLLRTLCVIVASTVVVLQFFITWNFQIRFNEVTYSSQHVWAAYANDADEAERCQALATWNQEPWPAYYRQALINGLQWAHDEYRGEPYCDDLWDLTTAKPDTVGP